MLYSVVVNGGDQIKFIIIIISVGRLTFFFFFICNTVLI